MIEPMSNREKRWLNKSRQLTANQMTYGWLAGCPWLKFGSGTRQRKRRKYARMRS